jgi:hypothetical protein
MQLGYGRREAVEHLLAMGQLISKCSFEMTVSSKIPTKYFWISALNFFVASWAHHLELLE